jgi:hypothetical protein
MISKSGITDFSFLRTIIPLLPAHFDMSVVQNFAKSKDCMQLVNNSKSLLIKLTMTMSILATLNNQPQKWQQKSN